MKWGKIVLAAIVFTIIGQIIHTIFAQLEMAYYLMPEYFPVWSKIMMPTAGPPGMEFFTFSIILAFIAALIYSGAFDLLKASIPGASKIKKGIFFGIILFLVAGLPSMFTLYLLINLPAGLIASWTVSEFIIFLIGGAAIGKILA